MLIVAVLSRPTYLHTFTAILSYPSYHSHRTHCTPWQQQSANTRWLLPVCECLGKIAVANDVVRQWEQLPQVRSVFLGVEDHGHISAGIRSTRGGRRRDNETSVRARHAATQCPPFVLRRVRCWTMHANREKWRGAYVARGSAKAAVAGRCCKPSFDVRVRENIFLGSHNLLRPTDDIMLRPLHA